MSSGEGKGGGVVKATLAPVTDDRGSPLSDTDRKSKAVQVHFNPETLDITLSNNFKKSSGDSPTQLVDEATAQLSLELQFDTTHTGVDVRQDTGKIAAFLKPIDKLVQADKKKLPPPKVVEFEWGAIAFQGYIDSYSESLEFFSSDGVPLRAKVSLSLTQQERSFEPRSRENPETGQQGAFSSAGVGDDPFAGNAVETPILSGSPIGDAAAAANGIENARNPGVDALALPESGGLGRGPAAFASAGAGFSAGISGGIGAGAGTSVGFGVAGSTGGTVAAFSGLSARPPKLELSTVSVSDSMTAHASTTGPVSLGGTVRSQSGASFSADVRGRISFEGT